MLLLSGRLDVLVRLDEWAKHSLDKSTVGDGTTWYSDVRSLRQLVSQTSFKQTRLTKQRVNYIVDVYIWSAATALAAAAVVRSLFGAVFPLFASRMYENLGTQWASTVVAIIALLLA